jgi:uncharacterized protein (DUF2336 family)
MRMQEGMEPLTVLVAIGVAGYVAIMLAHVARVDLGVSHARPSKPKASHPHPAL